MAERSGPVVPFGLGFVLGALFGLAGGACGVQLLLGGASPGSDDALRAPVEVAAIEAIEAPQLAPAPEPEPEEAGTAEEPEPAPKPRPKASKPPPPAPAPAPPPPAAAASAALPLRRPPPPRRPC